MVHSRVGTCLTLTSAQGIMTNPDTRLTEMEKAPDTRHHSFFPKSIQHFSKETLLKHSATWFTTVPAQIYRFMQVIIITGWKKCISSLHLHPKLKSELFCMQGFADTYLQLAQHKCLGSVLVQIYFESQVRIDLPACLRNDNTRCINSKMLFFSSVFVIKISISLQGQAASGVLPHSPKHKGPPWVLLWNGKSSEKWSSTKGRGLEFVLNRKPTIISGYQQRLTKLVKQIPTASTGASASKAVKCDFQKCFYDISIQIPPTCKVP